MVILFSICVGDARIGSLYQGSNSHLDPELKIWMVLAGSGVNGHRYHSGRWHSQITGG